MDFNNIKEVSDLSLIGAGSFGCVYRFEDYTIKIYHPTIIVMLGAAIKNPNLKLHKNKFRRFKKRQKNIENSNLPIEPVYINKVFRGVMYKYVDGKTIISQKEFLDFEERKDISLKLIRNTKELTKNKIYHRDLKLNNILVDNNNDVKIIDFDDTLTKVTILPNHHYLKQTLTELRNCLNFIMYDADYNGFDCPLNYDDLENYVKRVKLKKR